MKLVFEKSYAETQAELIESIIEAIHKAANEGKKVKKIIVTKKEWDILCYPTNYSFEPSCLDSFYGFPIEVEDEK